MCRHAAIEKGISPDHSDVQLLADRLDLALHVLKSPFSELVDLGSEISWPLSHALAEARASATRDALDADDVEPLFSLPGLLDERLNVFVLVTDGGLIASGHAVIDGAHFIIAAEENEDVLHGCARELAYLLLDGLSKEPGPKVVFRKDAALSEKTDMHRPGPREHFAENFASSLLIPARGVALALVEIRRLLRATQNALGDVELLYLARIFGVDFKRMAKRCERLELLPVGGAAALDNYLLEKFGGAEARAGLIELPERPRVKINSIPRTVFEATFRSIRNGATSTDQALAVWGPSFLRGLSDDSGL